MVLLLAIGALAEIVDGQGAGKKALAMGQLMPAVQVETLKGEPVDLKTYSGTKPVLIEFWATWCGVCKALKPRIEAANKKYGDQVEFIIVAVPESQTREMVSGYVNEHGLPGRVVYDDKGNAMAAFGVAGTGYVFLLNAEGRVTYSGVGPTQDLEGAIQSMLGGR